MRSNPSALNHGPSLDLFAQPNNKRALMLRCLHTAMVQYHSIVRMIL